MISGSSFSRRAQSPSEHFTVTPGVGDEGTGRLIECGLIWHRSTPRPVSVASGPGDRGMCSSALLIVAAQIGELQEKWACESPTSSPAMMSGIARAPWPSGRGGLAPTWSSPNLGEDQAVSVTIVGGSDVYCPPFRTTRPRHTVICGATKTGQSPLPILAKLCKLGYG